MQSVAITKTKHALLPLTKITVDAQVRREMDETALQQLADDIQAHGLLQPILVRPTGKTYKVVAGHRRKFACEMAGLKNVPALIQHLNDDQVLEVQMAENLQREDLTTGEVAAIVVQLYKKHESLDTVALILNKSKSWVSKHIKFSERMHYRAEKLFEEGVTEDIELLLMLSDVYGFRHAEGEALETLIREADEKPTDTPIRVIARARLESAKAKATEARQQSQQHSPSRKASKPKVRNKQQLARDLLYSTKKPSDTMSKWNTQECTTFHGAMNEAYRAGQQLKREAVAMRAASSQWSHFPAYEIALWHGFIHNTREMAFDEAEYQPMLDSWWGELNAR